MCGIAGWLEYAGRAAVPRSRLESLRDAQTHRGPDAEGLWIDADERVGLAHRRLSILDLSPSGSQPMASADGRFQLVFNGEIYNFPSLRSELEGLGHEFVSTSDTEVLLHGYREWGLALLERLRGMFAFALHDGERGETLLARDPLGIKPLYYADDGSRVVFASEVQALRCVLDDGGVDPEGIASFLLWGSIAAPRTFYRGIRALPAGCRMRVRSAGVEAPEPYYRMEEDFGKVEPMEEAEASERLRAALLDSARHHLLADVPVGAFLSGGVDSPALVGLLSEALGSPLRTVTLAFDVPGLDESRLAREASQLYGSEHHEIPIRIESIRERMPDAIAALDQPSIDGINSYFVSEAAAGAGLKVCVSGVGGDELFGGYSNFARMPRIRSLHRRLGRLPGLGALLRPERAWSEARTPGPRSAKLSRVLAFAGSDPGAYFAIRGLFSPGEVRALLEPELAGALEACDPLHGLRQRLDTESLPEEERVSALELRNYLQVQLLRDIDATSMRHSLEVRTPLVDQELLRGVARVPAALRLAGPAKRRLREAPRPPLPASLWQRKKQGFTLPFDHWLRSGALPVEIPALPGLRPAELRRVEQRFRRGRVYWSRVWALMVLGRFAAA